MVGRVIALDLAETHNVTVADIDTHRLSGLVDGKVSIREVDASNSAELAAAAADFDMVVGAVPGFLGFDMLKTIIEARKPIVDISFCPEDPLTLHQIAVEKGVVAIVDAGVAPGLDNLILGHHDRSMTIESFECVVGGLPKHPKWPFLYKAPFSPIDVIEEYTRPARYVEQSNEITRPALSDPEFIWFNEAGTLEAFNTDGLRTLISTMSHVPNMKEKTLRYPGHRALIEALQHAGFFSDQEIDVGESPIRPIDATSRILVHDWALDPGEPEFTIMRVIVTGSESGQAVRYTYDLYDEYDPGTGFTSMARTTGFTCTAMVSYLVDHGILGPGVYPLELVGQMTGGFGFTLKHLSERGVNVRGRREELGDAG
jgi:saccharopine dehydrogenase-like NADP-dependent oxidoreductase